MTISPYKPVLAATLLLGCTIVGGSLQAESAPTGKASKASESGEALWTSYSCYACHGYRAQGAATGPRISAQAMPYESFEAVVRRPYGVMPAYSRAVLNDDRLRSMYGYLEAVGRVDQLKEERTTPGRGKRGQ